ncbi:MAG: ParM/StbA family protein, partial [Methanosphaera sp.]|nr:ParM/StbA family protein [Methanosphaera sp.]
MILEVIGAIVIFVEILMLIGDYLPDDYNCCMVPIIIFAMFGYLIFNNGVRLAMVIVLTLITFYALSKSEDNNPTDAADNYSYNYPTNTNSNNNYPNNNNYNNTNPIIIGIDHGYGNIKTAHCCFKTGVAAYDKEPTFKSNLLIYEGRYYLIGEEHKEFISDKMTDSDYYILTLAAVARELNIRKLTSARVHLAAGLPLTWVSEQKDSFKAYLLQNGSADFTFKGVDYHVEFAGADIFPQGFSAVADKLREFKGINMLCDIGNGTMNVMYINECRPLAKKCFTEKYGTNQCMLAVRENLMKQFGVSVDETVLERVI